MLEDFLLLDCKLSFLAIFANGLVYSAVGTAADEAYYIIPISDPDFAGIPTGSSCFNGICINTRLAYFSCQIENRMRWRESIPIAN